jgi:hypothetical protein
MTCEACDKPLGVLEAMRWTVCMECTVARARAVQKRRCVCTKRQQRPTDIKRVGSRSWISCERCLGQIKQLS